MQIKSSKNYIIILLMAFQLIPIAALAAKSPLSSFGDALKRCVGALSVLSGPELGKAWQTAGWRNGNHPFRYYNSEALDRVMTDPDLNEVAQKWATLNSKNKNSKLMDQTYQYLVGLADLRIKYELPIGGTPGAPKPMLEYLRLVLENAENGVDTEIDVALLTELNQKFFHLEKGFDLHDENEFREFLMRRLQPRLHALSLARDFRAP